MTKLDEVTAWLQDRLPALIAEHQVPAAAVAVLSGGEVADAAAGLLSTATRVEATPDSVFQIGSITKV
jgi:CubicO group peptidase (beta-lactamase class C family)